MDTTSLGDRMKSYESSTDARLLPELPIVIRLDGRKFSNFTKGMKRPFDDCFREAMIETTKFLVNRFVPKMAYTQSDEITLLLNQDSLKQQTIFDGRVQKITSVFSGQASAFFLTEVMKRWPEKLDFDNLMEKDMPCFDARVFAVPSKVQAYNAFLWREQDATKNSILMVSQATFGHSKILGINTNDLQKKLLFEKDINWNDYTPDQKRGTYIRKEKRLVKLEAERLAKIPEGKRPKNGEVERNLLTVVDMPPINRVANAVEVLFDGEQPVLRTSDDE